MLIDHRQDIEEGKCQCDELKSLSVNIQNMNGGGMENLIEEGSQGVALIVTCNTCTFFDFVTLA